MTHLYGLLPEEVEERFGASPQAARRILAAVVGAGRPVASVEGVRKSLLAAIEPHAAPPVRVVARHGAADGFVKYLFDNGVEAVRIPLPCEAPGADTSAYEGKEKKVVVCVSSQAGCALACSFCATGELGFRRNLSAAEIVAQVLAVRDERSWAAPASIAEDTAEDRPVRGVVFMGMGEPFLNYEEVIRAARILSHPCGGHIDARAITISTAGIVPQIRRFTAEGHKFRLAVSLTHAVPHKRLPLMPIERVHPTAELVAALHDHARARRTRVLVEYVLLGGVNDGVDDARALCELLDRTLVKVDVIDVNGGVGGYVRSTRKSEFLEVLVNAGMPFAVRYSGGQDVAAGCGQLSAGRPGGSFGPRLST